MTTGHNSSGLAEFCISGWFCLPSSKLMLVEERRIRRKEFTGEKMIQRKKKIRNFKQGVAFTIGSDNLGLNLGSSPELLEESPLLAPAISYLTAKIRSDSWSAFQGNCQTKL